MDGDRTLCSAADLSGCGRDGHGKTPDRPDIDGEPLSPESTMIPYSLLDLAPVTEGSTPREAFANTLDLARHAEALSSHRYWLAEHHNMPGIASAATAVLIGTVAGGTSTIRVGGGGVMRPNPAPLQVAEKFGTLARSEERRVGNECVST